MVDRKAQVYVSADSLAPMDDQISATAPAGDPRARKVSTLNPKEPHHRHQRQVHVHEPHRGGGHAAQQASSEASRELIELYLKN